MLLGVGIVAAVAGRAFQITELYVISITAVAALLAAVAVRLLHRSQLEVKRHVTKTMVAVGEPLDVHLVVLNRSRLPSATVRAAEKASGSGSGEFRCSFAPLPGGGRAIWSYRLHPERRGITEIGPAELTDTDAMGLAQLRRQIGNISKVIVHPPVHQLLAPILPDGGGLSLPVELRLRSSGLTGEEFEGLRPYVDGDDLRHVHWRSTARLDDLMVRKFQPAKPGRLTVVIDTRPPGDQSVVQDLTTSVAASIVCAVLGNGEQARIVTSDGRVTPILTPSRVNEALEFLALLQDGRPEFIESNFGVGSQSDNASCVVVTACPKAVHNEAARHELAQRFEAWLVITCNVSQLGLAYEVTQTPPISATVNHESSWIHLSSAAQLPELWREFLTGIADTASSTRSPAGVRP